jgi:hypothetical protein
MPLRLVLHAEGAGETAGPSSVLGAAPGQELEAGRLGAGHLLLGRVVSSLVDDVVAFHEPWKTRRGRIAKGSDLLHAQTLRQLLTWPLPESRPDIAVVLVDRDGDRERERFLLQTIEDMQTLPVRVIGVAAEEFEAWLIADHVALGAVIGSTIDMTQDPESMKPGEAKAFLASCLVAHADPAEARRQLARSLDLGTIARRCNSLRVLKDRLADAVRIIGATI